VVIDEMEGREYGKQTRLAEIAGCARAVVHHWLSGDQREIKYDHAKNLATKLGYRLEWIMEGKGPKREGEQEQPQAKEEELFMRLSIEEVKIITHYRAANKIGKQLIELTAAGAPKEPTSNH
jgi:transcriptional regulator with XRE-family HTH domain